MDLRLIETGDGGDVVKNAKDLHVIEGFENMPYISMFGGNVKQSTPTRRVEAEQAFDYWGNNLLWPNDSSLQFNSITERALQENALSSSGRLVIEQAVKQDLKAMQDFSEVSVSTEITTVDRLRISIILRKPGNLQDRTFIYIWDSSISELSEMIE